MRIKLLAVGIMLNVLRRLSAVWNMILSRLLEGFKKRTV